MKNTVEQEKENMSSRRVFLHLICFVLISIVSLNAVAEAASSSSFQPQSYSKGYSSSRAGGQSSSRARSSSNNQSRAATNDYASHLLDFLTVLKRQPIWSSLGGLIKITNDTLFRQERNDASSDHPGLNNSDSSFPAMARIATLLLYSFLSAELLNGTGFFRDEHSSSATERSPSELFQRSGIVDRFQSLQLSFSQWFQTNTAPGGALRFSTWKDKLNDTLFAENYLTYRWHSLSEKNRFAIGCVLGAISIRSLTVVLNTVRSVGLPLYLLSEVVRNLRRMPAPEWTADWSGLDGQMRECAEEWDAAVRDGLRRVDGMFRTMRRSVRRGIRLVDDQLEKVRMFIADPSFGGQVGDWVEEETVLVVGLLAGSVFGFFWA